MDEIKLDEIVEKVNSFIKEHEMKIFNGNYFFFNIYQCLKRLVTLDFYPEDTSAIELIPLFYTILNEDIKMQIQKDFQRIEESNKPLIEKIKEGIQEKKGKKIIVADLTSIEDTICKYKML